MASTSHTNLIVWQKSMELVTHIYRITTDFPKDEQFGITSQMRRAAVSIPSNIAEDRRRGTTPEFKRFLSIAYGSGAELETQLEICRRIGYLRNPEAECQNLMSEVMRILNALIT